MSTHDESLGRRVRAAAGVLRGERLTFTFDGRPVAAFRGETVAAALIASNRRAFRRTLATGAARGMFCGMGVCFDCLVVIDGEPSQRACIALAHDGLRVETQIGNGEAS